MSTDPQRPTRRQRRARQTAGMRAAGIIAAVLLALAVLLIWGAVWYLWPF